MSSIPTGRVPAWVRGQCVSEGETKHGLNALKTTAIHRTKTKILVVPKTGAIGLLTVLASAGEELSVEGKGADKITCTCSARWLNPQLCGISSNRFSSTIPPLNPHQSAALSCMSRTLHQ